MITLTVPAPPTAEALTAALTMLAVAADPERTRQRLEELAAKLVELQVTHAAVMTSQQAAADAQAGLADLREREDKLVANQAALDQGHAQMAVASAAIADRERAVSRATVALETREAEIVTKERALDERIASYRKALA